MLKPLIKILIVVLISLPFLAWYFISAPTNTTFSGEYTPNSLANADNLQNHVKVLSHSLPARSDDVDTLNLSAEYIYTEFSKYSADVSFQEYDVWGIGYKNIIAKYGTQDCGGLYIIGAHYDSYNGLPGADDNASGVAGLIEIARLFEIAPPKCRVQLVAYTLEEPPYFRTEDMGSFYHAKNLHDNNINVQLMISLEMIGYFSDEENSQQYPLSILKKLYPSTGNYIGVISNLSDTSITKNIKSSMLKATPLPVYSINAPPFVAGIDFSDHRNYWLFNYPAIMITDTSFFRNHRYHTEMDTWDTLNYQKMAMVVDGVFQAIHQHMTLSESIR